VFSPGKKVAVVLLTAAMLAAVGVIIYASRRAAEARGNPSSHANRINEAVRQCDRMLNE